MLDIHFILEDHELVRQTIIDRNVEANVDEVIRLWGDLKESRQELQQVNERSNRLAKRFPQCRNEKERSALKEESSELKQTASTLQGKIAKLEPLYNTELCRIPNVCDPDTPFGNNEEGNIPLRYFGEPPQFDFLPKDHLELGKTLDLIDFEAGARVSGSKFYFLKNEAVILELALIRYCLDVARRHGFTLLMPPEIVRDEMIVASGFTPRGPESQVYSMSEGCISLIGTAEIPIGGYISGTTWAEEQLPIRFAGVSHCFRTEAGGHGRESRGLYRVHQFSKVELYQFEHPDKSLQALEDLVAIEEEIYQSLGLPYRVMLMCRGELGAPAYKKYDIEAWMPFLNGYGEITSASNCTDFQARRLQVRYKDSNTGKSKFLHTLNGTGVAVTRAILAILENFQHRDGSVRIPETLCAYTGFDRIDPK